MGGGKMPTLVSNEMMAQINDEEADELTEYLRQMAGEEAEVGGGKVLPV